MQIFLYKPSRKRKRQNKARKKWPEEKKKVATKKKAEEVQNLNNTASICRVNCCKWKVKPPIDYHKLTSIKSICHLE